MHVRLSHRHPFKTCTSIGASVVNSLSLCVHACMHASVLYVPTPYYCKDYDLRRRPRALCIILGVKLAAKQPTRALGFLLSNISAKRCCKAKPWVSRFLESFALEGQIRGGGFAAHLSPRVMMIRIIYIYIYIKKKYIYIYM